MNEFYKFKNIIINNNYNILNDQDEAVDTNAVVGSAEYIQSLHEVNADESIRTRYGFTVDC